MPGHYISSCPDMLTPRRNEDEHPYYDNHYDYDDDAVGNMTGEPSGNY